MKKLFYFAFAALLCCGMGACSDDDEGINSADLIGKWTVVKEVINWDGEIETEEYYPGEAVMVFNADGTYTAYEDGVYLATLSYAVSGNQLILMDEEERLPMRIQSLTDSELVLYADGYDEGEYVQMTTYFERYE